MKQSVKQALRSLSDDPSSGQPLLRELEGFWKYGVRRFRIVNSIAYTDRVIQILAVGHRREIYERVAEQVRRRKPPR